MASNLRVGGVLIGLVLVAACGGKGQDIQQWQDELNGRTGGSGTLASSSSYAQQCAADNPYVGDAETSTTAGSLDIEKKWIRSYINEAYLWYNQVPSVDANGSDFTGSMTSLDYSGVPLPLSNYFEALKTTATTSSGSLVDKFSFTYPTKAWNDLSQSGISAGYGIEWAYIASSPPRSWRIALVQPGSPASTAGLRRGDSIVAIDGVDFVNGSDVDTLNAGLFPSLGGTHSFTFARSGSSNFTVNLTGANIVGDPVPMATVINYQSRKVGYLQFTDHIATAESKLISAVNYFNTQGISDLVLDLRYNPGGYLYIASELAYMIAGDGRTSGKNFERLVFNDKRSSENETTPFYNADINSQALPSLNLSRVFVIVQGSTCSASESVINSLMGVDVEVVLIGGTTCGKPYGFTAKDNCGVSYFPIEFKGENAKGFSDYSDGFTPVTSGTGGANVLGCPQNDDLDHALGNTSETMLATALQRLADGTCLPKTGRAVTPTSLAMKRTTQGLVGLPTDVVRQRRLLLPNGKVR